MAKRSAAVVELENQLREMLGPSGGLIETRWVGRLVDLMKETANTDGRAFLIKVILNTPQTEKATLTRFIQLGGVDILGNWINEHKKSQAQEDKEIINSILSSLNKLTITMDILEKTEIGKIVNNLSKVTDPSIQAKAKSIVSKWKKLVAPSDEERKQVIKPPKIKETKVSLPKKYYLFRPRLEEKPLIMEEPIPMEEVYLPASSPPIIENEPEPSPINIENKSGRSKKTVRWVLDEHLERVKYFRRNDEPNAKCASLRPYEPDLEDDRLKITSVEDFRKRESQMERELNRKEREKEDSIRVLLENMTPRIMYTSLIRNLHSAQKILRSDRCKKPDSLERLDQERREQSVLKVIYQRESDVPKAPREATGPEKAVTVCSQAVPLIPSFKVNFTQPIPQQNIEMAKPAPMPTMPTPSMSIQQPMMDQMAMYSMMYQNPAVQYPMMLPRVFVNQRNSRPPNYRTEPCRNFHSPAGCTHGDNCHFIHDFDYPGVPIPDLDKWRRSNETRMKNIKAMQSMNMNYGMATYYPPPGPESHLMQKP